MDRKKFYKGVDYLLILLGIFLIADRLYLHRIVFDYGTVGLNWLDQWFDHWVIGVVLILIAVWDLRKLSSKSDKKSK